MKSSAFLLSIFVLMGASIGARVACAQTYQPSNRVPVADNTLGTQVLSNNNNFAITGGISRGQNTFHSFQDFSVPTNGVATFANPVGNQSIITRVTGSLFSDINGTINTQGANFLLINPNGVVFGPGTQLNVGRVFAASTANGIDLADGTGRTLTFGVNGAGDGALLSIDPKVIFNVSRLNLGGGSGEINNFGTLQTNNQGQYIGLIGGNINNNGGRIFSRRGGRVELGGLATAGSVGVGIEGTNLRLSFPLGVDRANVSITNSSNINTSGTGGADVAITAKNIEVLGGSTLASGVLSGQTAAGDVVLNATENVKFSGANSLVGNITASGKGGNVLINAGSLIVEGRAAIGTTSSDRGDAGNITILSKGKVSVNSGGGIVSSVLSGAEGNGGNIVINAESFSAQNSLIIGTLVEGKGNGGSVTIKTKNDTVLSNSSVFSTLSADGIGKGGDILFDTGDLVLKEGRILTSTSGQGNAGNIILLARNAITTSQGTTSSIISSDVNAGAVGKGGDINLNAGKISSTNAFLNVSTAGNGDAGNISIFADGNVSFAKALISSTVNSGAIGQGGNISINGGAVSFNENSRFIASTEAQGGTGNIAIISPGIVSLTEESNLVTNIDKTGVGKGGDVNINAGSLLVNNGSILTSTNGQGNAGSTNIFIKDTASLTSGSTIANNVRKGGIGNSGNISIKASSLLGDSSRISSSTFGQGNAGNIFLGINDAVSFSNFNVFTSVASGGVGQGGNIDITAGSLSFNRATQLLSIIRAASATEPAGRGNAGNITVKVAGLANFDTSINTLATGLDTGTEVGAEGNGGNITLEAGSISLKDGAGFRSSVAGTGNSGNILVTATGKVSFDNVAGVLSRLEATGTGNAGDIKISGSDISLTNGAGLTAETLGKGNAGNITVNATNSIFLSGVGNNSRSVSNIVQGGLFSSSRNVSGTAGNINVAAPNIILDNKAIINTQSDFGGGGNIVVGNQKATDFLFLRRGSQIATDAGVVSQQGGDGGNININANFIIAKPQENNDISANAARGQGGNVNINSQGLFGIQQRPQPSSSSDITASSSFGQNGIININTPGIDPGKDTSELPSSPTDTTRQISQTCNSNQLGNKFYATGRGGHPATSEDHLTNDVVWLNPRNSPVQSTVNNSLTQSIRNSPQPAVSWVFDNAGKVRLLSASAQGEIDRAKISCNNF